MRSLKKPGHCLLILPISRPSFTSTICGSLAIHRIRTTQLQYIVFIVQSIFVCKYAGLSFLKRGIVCYWQAIFVLLVFLLETTLLTNRSRVRWGRVVLLNINCIVTELDREEERMKETPGRRSGNGRKHKSPNKKKPTKQKEQRLRRVTFRCKTVKKKKIKKGERKERYFFFLHLQPRLNTHQRLPKHIVRDLLSVYSDHNLLVSQLVF